MDYKTWFQNQYETGEFSDTALLSKALAKEGYTKYRMKMIDPHRGIMLVLVYK